MVDCKYYSINSYVFSSVLILNGQMYLYGEYRAGVPEDKITLQCVSANYYLAQG